MKYSTVILAFLLLFITLMAWASVDVGMPSYISSRPAATLPLNQSDRLLLNQGGVAKQLSPADIVAGNYSTFTTQRYINYSTQNASRWINRGQNYRFNNLSTGGIVMSFGTYTSTMVRFAADGVYKNISGGSRFRQVISW